MVEVIGRAEDGDIEWDLIPQLQLSLNVRQHVLANVGLLVPVNDNFRPKQFFFYILWEWFDGGLLDGW